VWLEEPNPNDFDAGVQVGSMSGCGPRVEESGLGLITGYSFSAPYEDVRLKGR
jgi:peptide/nickel transport system substrate-binding protein